MQITRTIARPVNRGLSVAARLLLEIIFQVVADLVDTGAWPLAVIERERNGAIRKRAPVAAAPAG